MQNKACIISDTDSGMEKSKKFMLCTLFLQNYIKVQKTKSLFTNNQSTKVNLFTIITELIVYKCAPLIGLVIFTIVNVEFILCRSKPLPLQ